MQLSLILLKRLVFRSTAACVLIFCLPAAQTMAQAAAGGVPASAGTVSAEHDPQVDAAFEHFYNLEYDRAIQEFERVLDRRPNDPSAANHLLTTILMRELYRMGAMNSGEYANDSF